MFELKISYVGPSHVTEPNDDWFIDYGEEDNYKNTSRSILLLSSDPDSVFSAIVDCCCNYADESKDKLEMLKTKVKDFMISKQEICELVSNNFYKCTIHRYPIKINASKFKSSVNNNR